MFRKTLIALSILAALPAFADGLNKKQSDVLMKALAGSQPGDIVLACAHPECSLIATEVAAAFVGAKWNVTSIRHGGLGIDGIIGIRIEYCGIKPAKITDTIRDMHMADVTEIDDGECKGEGHHLFVIFGGL